jgi:hypothetical protein
MTPSEVGRPTRMSLHFLYYPFLFLVVKAAVKLALCVIKHHGTETYGGGDVIA